MKKLTFLTALLAFGLFAMAQQAQQKPAATQQKLTISKDIKPSPVRILKINDAKPATVATTNNKEAQKSKQPNALVGEATKPAQPTTENKKK